MLSIGHAWRLTRATSLVCAAFAVGSPALHGAEPARSTTVLGMTFEELSRGIGTDSTWNGLFAQSGRSDCSRAQTIDKARDSAKVRASARHEAALAYQSCVALLEGLILSNLSRPASAGDIATAQALVEALAKEAEALTTKTNAEQTFMGLRVGVGIGASFGSKKRITEAELAQDGTIRVLETQSTEPRVILESHYFGFCSSSRCNAGTFGHGPYFGIVAKDDKALSAVSGGYMWGWKDARNSAVAGFSVGVGLILDSDVRDLAAGFEEGEAPPAGETTVKFASRSRVSGLAFFTRTF